MEFLMHRKKKQDAPTDDEAWAKRGRTIRSLLGIPDNAEVLVAEIAALKQRIQELEAQLWDTNNPDPATPTPSESSHGLAEEVDTYLGLLRADRGKDK
jgi:hypothetical protein